MKTKVKKLPRSKVELEIEVEALEFEKFFEKAVSDLNRGIKVSGFRPGKVPREIVLKKVGKDAVLREATRLAIEHSYKKAIRDKNLEPISQPQIDILKLAAAQPFCFRASFVIIPLIELPDYKSVVFNIQRKKIFVEDSEIRDALKWLQKSRPRFKQLQRPAQKGDFVEIEFSSSQIDPVKSDKVGAKQFNRGEKGKTHKDAFILGKGRLIRGFEKEIEGMKSGEQKNFSLNVPPDYFQKEIAGEKPAFEVRMNSVKEVEFPEINDQFARGIGNFENLASLRKGIKEGLKIEKEIAETQRIRTKILEEIEKNCKFESPVVLVKAEKQRMLNGLRQKVLKDFNLGLKDYLEKIKKSEKELLDSFEPEAQKLVRQLLILRAIAKRENIKISEEEIKEEINRILKQYPDIERDRKGLALEKLKDYTKERMRNEKTLVKLESFTRNSKSQ